MTAGGLLGDVVAEVKELAAGRAPRRLHPRLELLLPLLAVGGNRLLLPRLAVDCCRWPVQQRPQGSRPDGIPRTGLLNSWRLRDSTSKGGSHPCVRQRIELKRWLLSGYNMCSWKLSAQSKDGELAQRDAAGRPRISNTRVSHTENYEDSVPTVSVLNTGEADMS